MIKVDYYPNPRERFCAIHQYNHTSTHLELSMQIVARISNIFKITNVFVIAFSWFKGSVSK